ncbi:MAG TPA: ribosomal protein S18-alanine N-acetyltransferase [archaeon]|nr:ribosomal protein S18-alanine N-acetyltransferase [archaeon]
MTNYQLSGEERLIVELVPLAVEHMGRVLEIERTCFTEPWSEKDFLKLIRNPDSICLAALAVGRVIGYSCTWVVIESAELGNIAVDPEFQGRSVGRQLLEQTMRLCAARKVTLLFLEVRCSNLRAIELYTRYGFEKIGLRRGYYSRPVEDALIMRLEL